MNAAALAELLGEQAKRERARLGGHAKHDTKPPACLEAAAVYKQPKTTSRAAVARGARVSERKVRQAQEVPAHEAGAWWRPKIKGAKIAL